MEKLMEDLERGFGAQVELTSSWHVEEGGMEAEYESIMASACTLDLADIIAAQHFMNYSLWHVEDTARRLDVPAETIADCKRKIDVFNQKRNDLMEKADETIMNAISPFLPPNAAEKYNTETLGMAIDRMSIMALKIFHMREQAERADAGQEHIAKCRRKLSQLMEQRVWLKRAIFDLVDDFFAGRKSIRPYFQHKMYNDETLNPELYGKS
ncbi:MAG: DUF4254 domain-containing protein [Synergistaceae bacterium]|nr:DUF4254 domain-containing protein [Synergistaceae bacterium]